MIHFLIKLIECIGRFTLKVIVFREIFEAHKHYCHLLVALAGNFFDLQHDDRVLENPRLFYTAINILFAMIVIAPTHYLQI